MGNSKMKMLLYCTKSKPYLYKMPDCYIVDSIDKGRWGFPLNGKIVAECDYEVETIHCETHYEPEVNIGVGILPEFTCNQYSTETLGHFKLLEKSCLKDLTLPYEEHRNELDNYLQGKDGYAICIKNLHIFDEPKELNDFMQENPCFKSMWGWVCEPYINIKKAPQNMMYAYDDFDNRYILISIRPEWLVKILNGEKVIEIRKKVLKEMLK